MDIKKKHMLIYLFISMLASRKKTKVVIVANSERMKVVNRKGMG
jgi:hypothetical protein